MCYFHKSSLKFKLNVAALLCHFSQHKMRQNVMIAMSLDDTDECGGPHSRAGRRRP